jgi:hypothetical protein
MLEKSVLRFPRKRPLILTPLRYNIKHSMHLKNVGLIEDVEGRAGKRLIPRSELEVPLSSAFAF